MRYCLFLVLLSLFIQGCGVSEREKNIKKAQQELARKEQDLLNWEQQLKIKERALEQAIDSARRDSTAVYHPAISGKWNVKMTCTETSCEGSALGDTKTEQWLISYKKNTIVVKAYAGVVLTRVYIGAFEGETLKVLDENPSTDAVISALLRFKTDNRMEGQREIQQKNCKIVYSLQAERTK